MSDLRLNNAATLWQSSFMMSRLVNVFIAECNARIVNKQNSLLEQLASGHIQTIDMMQEFRDELLTDLDEMKALITTCEAIDDLHIANVQQHRDPAVQDNRNTGTAAEHMESFELCVFGYIRQHIEVELEWYIPHGVKQLCFMFHGNFVMDSCILSSNEIACIGMILSSILRKNGLKTIKLFDTQCDGFDADTFDRKCKCVANSIGVIRSSYDHVFVSYSMDYWQDMDVWSNPWPRTASFLFGKSYETTARILRENVYVFPNDFDPLVLQEKAIDQVFTSGKEGKTDFPGDERILQFNAIPRHIDIDRFEMFQLCTV
eukprot:33137_1